MNCCNKYYNMYYVSQQTLKSPGSSARNSISGSSSSTDTEPTNSAPPATRNRYKPNTVPARPRAGSDSTSTKGAVSKMMDLFRHRSQSAVSAEDKRKAVSFYKKVLSITIISSIHSYITQVASIISNEVKSCMLY